MANENFIKTRIKQKIDSIDNWINKNPILLSGEIGIVSGDRPRIKVGDGVHTFSQLDYATTKITNGKLSSLASYSDLSIIIVTPEEYSQQLQENAIADNIIYIISANYIYGYDKPIKYVGDGVEATDAATINQLSSKEAEIKTYINDQLATKANIPHNHDTSYLKLTGGNISGTISAKQLSVSSITNISSNGKNLSNLISSAYTTADTQLSTSLTTLIDNKTTVYIGDTSSLNKTSDLSIVKLSPHEYAEKLFNGDIPNNELNIVQTGQLYGYDKPIKYVGNGEEDSDAATYGQLTNILSDITISDTTAAECARVLKLILQRFGGSSTI